MQERLITYLSILLVAAILPHTALAQEQFLLRDGTTLEGEVVRRSSTSITIKHKAGLATYQIDELSPETTDEYYSQLEQRAAADKERSRERITQKTVTGWADSTLYEKVQTVSLFAGLAFLVVAELWFIIAAFSVSAFWGVIILIFGGLRSIATGAIYLLSFLFFASLIPAEARSEFPVLLIVGIMATSMIGIVFILRHWKAAIGPLTAGFIGLALLILAGIMHTIWNAA